MEKVQNTIDTTHDALKKSKWLLITYGSAWVYNLKGSDICVNNCHKKPSTQFSKNLLSPEQIVKSFQEMYNHLKSFNSEINLILTLSPVRHVKDTLELNAVSKAIVRYACHEISSKVQDVEYFPAYEMMVDDLRDYRFYKADLIHPTEQAEDYIWNKFIERYMTASTSEFISRWKEIRQALLHRPFHPQSIGHQNFLKQTLSRLEQLKETVNVDAEIQFIQAQLLDRQNLNQSQL